MTLANRPRTTVAILAGHAINPEHHLNGSF